MKSIKFRLMLIITVLLLISGTSIATISLSKNADSTQEIVDYQYTEKIKSANNMLSLYMYEQFGSLKLNNKGTLVDETNTPIEGNYVYIDKFSESMNVVSTIFVKKENNYERLLTTVKDESGTRLEGTLLDSSGDAYRSISNGDAYYGMADIQGINYLTGYEPMYDSNDKIIGVYFCGVPMTDVNSIIAENEKETTKNIVIFSILIVGIALFITYVISSTITKPITKITDVTDCLAKGELDTEVKIKSKDEIGKLANSLKSLVNRLKGYIEYINEISYLLKEIGEGNLNLEFKHAFNGDFAIIKDALANTSDMLNGILSEFKTISDQVASGANQVSDGSQTLAQGSTEQAASIQELSATVDGMENEIKKTADLAKESNEATVLVGSMLKTGTSQIQELTSAMEVITNTSNEIGKIIKTIDDIAFQTNIIALNAAVEAARAGEAGKGFAVVADEVRNLAQKSAASAKDTTTLIQNSIVAIENGSIIVEKTAQTYSEIATTSTKVVDSSNKIAETCEHEALQIAQITQTIDQISTVVQQNASTAEESAAASEELSGQANMLKNHIEKFKLKENN